jgi:hypothetical protein
MEFNSIRFKKPSYKVKAHLKEHLKQYTRLCTLPLKYEDLETFSDLIPIYDNKGNETLWYSALYNYADLENYHQALLKIYDLLTSDGSLNPFLKIASIDFCSYGNSKPFRIKILNEINDNHDYFYIKKADASRVYGLELEEIFSPNKVSFLVDGSTMIEEHVVGIPCDEFITKNKNVKIDNRLRFAKEFVKFNECCFTRLLGDMRAYNFVVQITQDFDNVQYRFRAMDFDQQSYEGRKSIYLPQYYKDNVLIVELCMELLTDNVAQQYKKEERVAMRKRFIAHKQRAKSLLRRLSKDKISSNENIETLRGDLAQFHKNPAFHNCGTMGEILILHIEHQLNIKIF